MWYKKCLQLLDDMDVICLNIVLITKIVYYNINVSIIEKNLSTCNQCHYQATPDNSKTQKLVHYEKVKDFACNKCDCRCVNKCNLAVHIRRDHS